MRKGVSKVAILGIVALFLVVTATSFYVFKRQKQKAIDEENNRKDVRTVTPVTVTADKGKFTPSDIKTELFGDIDLTIKAIDKDYTFRVDGYPRLNADVKKGQSVKVPVYSLGVGEYKYTCGEGCTGKIVVSQQIDTEEGENEK